MIEKSFKIITASTIFKKILKKEKNSINPEITIASIQFNNIKERFKRVFSETRGNKITTHCI